MRKNTKKKSLKETFSFNFCKLKDIDELIFFFYTTVLLMKYFVVYLPLQISKDNFTAGFM